MGNTFSTRPGNTSRPPRKESPQLEPVHKGHIPTRQDIQIAAQILMGLQLQAPPGHLPAELALSILAHADYRPRVTSSCARQAFYTRGGGRQWYLTIPELPTDFGRASSVTLQVRSEDRTSLLPAVGGYYPGDDYYPGDGYETADEERDRPHSTWFELCILRPVHRSPPSPPINGYALDGCVLREVPEPEPETRTPQERPRGRWLPDDEDADLIPDAVLVAVQHNGRNTWDIYHHNCQVTATLSVEQVNGALTIDPERTPPRGCATYRVDCPAGNNPASQDPEAFVDGEGFLSALMPGDMIVLWAGSQVSSQSDTL